MTDDIKCLNMWRQLLTLGPADSTTCEAAPERGGGYVHGGIARLGSEKYLSLFSWSTIVLYQRGIIPSFPSHEARPMHMIEVDFDVYKQLTVRRTTEDVTCNDVIRELLGLGPSKTEPRKVQIEPSSADWVAKGVRFPEGTEFRANYKGQMRTGRVEGGSLLVNGRPYDSPSAAAVAITGSAVNGWRFWECRFAGDSSWKLIESLRR
jgi:hypothetical protein